MVHYHITVSGAQRQQHNVFQCRWLVSISVTHNRSVPTSFPDYTTYPGDMRSSAEFPNATNSLHMLLWKSFLFFNTISTVGQGKCNFFFPRIRLHTNDHYVLGTIVYEAMQLQFRKRSCYQQCVFIKAPHRPPLTHTHIQHLSVSGQQDC